MVTNDQIRILVPLPDHVSSGVLILQIGTASLSFLTPPSKGRTVLQVRESTAALELLAVQLQSMNIPGEIASTASGQPTVFSAIFDRRPL